MLYLERWYKPCHPTGDFQWAVWVRCSNPGVLKCPLQYLGMACGYKIIISD